MQIRRKKPVFNLSLTGVLLLGWLLLAGSALAGDNDSLQSRIVKMLNLEAEITVEKFYNGDDLVALWYELDTTGTMKNWGIVTFLTGEPVDSWFYTGTLTNRFTRFHSSFHHLLGDGRREFVIAAEGEEGIGWVKTFVFNLEDKKVKLVYQGENLLKAAGSLTVSGQTYTPESGMFADLNTDGVEELLVYGEVKGASPWTIYWTDIYSWNGKEFVLQNKQYPQVYQPLLTALQRVAEEEEGLPAGQYRKFYEHMVRIYQIWDRPEEAEYLKTKMNLPPLEMGKKLQPVLQAGEYEVLEMHRVNLDGISPLDALVRAKKADGSKQAVWIITQAKETAGEPLALPLPDEYFLVGAEITFAVKDAEIWVYRKPLKDGVGKGYLFLYDGVGQVLLRGTEERRFLNDRVTRVVLGEMYPDPDISLAGAELYQMAMLQAKALTGTVQIDGMFSETGWPKSSAAKLDQKREVIAGVQQWSGAEDLSCSVMAATQDSSLYLGVKVTDDVRIYAQESLPDQPRNSDHIEICFLEQEILHRYGIFILPTHTQVVEWVGDQVVKSSYPVQAQWMPSPGGYWVEVKLDGLTLTADTYPLTVLVCDTDNAQNPALDTVLATSAYIAEDPGTIGLVILK